MNVIQASKGNPLLNILFAYAQCLIVGDLPSTGK